MGPDKQQTVTDYTKKDGTYVRSHTRSAQWARARSTWIGAGFSTLVAAGILWEFGITLISTACVVLTALLGTIAVIAGNYVESNRKTMAQQRTRATRTTRTSRAGGATRTRSASSSRRTSGRRTSSRRRR
jgi:hypothetical protein